GEARRQDHAHARGGAEGAAGRGRQGVRGGSGEEPVLRQGSRLAARVRASRRPARGPDPPAARARRRALLVEVGDIEKGRPWAALSVARNSSFWPTASPASSSRPGRRRAGT